MNVFILYIRFDETEIDFDFLTRINNKVSGATELVSRIWRIAIANCAVIHSFDWNLFPLKTSFFDRNHVITRWTEWIEPEWMRLWIIFFVFFLVWQTKRRLSSIKLNEEIFKFIQYFFRIFFVDIHCQINMMKFYLSSTGKKTAKKMQKQREKKSSRTIFESEQ